MGPVVYARQTGPGGDLGNDFGIVEIPSLANDHIRPSMPVFGGPTQTETISVGKLVCHHGNGLATGETFLTKGRIGVGYQPIRARAFGAPMPRQLPVIPVRRSTSAFLMPMAYTVVELPGSSPIS